MKAKKNVSLSFSRGEKSRKGGLTAKGRAAYNRATGSHLQAPQAKGKRHKSFCARSRGWHGERGLLARKRWKC